MMKAYSSYGLVESPELTEVTSKTRCHYCNPNLSLKTKYFKNGDKAVLMVVNAGPTGRVFICMNHARELHESLGKILENE